MNVTLKQLRAFYEVARARSFTAAARRLFLTQSAVSMLVRQLESEIGMLVFTRQQRAAELTEAGTYLLPVAERIFDDVRQIEEGITSLRMLKRGKLQLAVPQMLACSWLPSIIARYRQHYGDVALNIVDTTGDRVLAAVLDNEAEIGIGPRRPVPAGAEASLIWKEPIRVVCRAGSELANRPGVSWSELHEETWIQYSDDFSLHLEQMVWPAFQTRIPRNLRVRYLSTALAFVGQGLGITAAPQYASTFIREFPVSFVRVGEPELHRQFYFYKRRGHVLSPAAQAFSELLEVDLGNLGPSGSLGEAGSLPDR